MPFSNKAAIFRQKKHIVAFLAINVLLSIIPLAVMFAQHRIPSTEDAFFHLLSQFNIYNEAATKGNLPYWMPFVAHGQNSALVISLQLTPFSPVICLLGLAGVKVNFLWFYYLGMWFDEFMLQIGIFLLATIYYRRMETAVFVAVCLVGGIIWSCQIWNLHQIYFLPLALYALHKTIISKEFKWLFALALFLSFGFNGVALYNIVFTLFVLSIYFLATFPVHRSDFNCFQNFKPTVVFTLKTFTVAALFAFSILNVVLGMKTLEVGGRGRDASGHVPLDTFMSYGGSIGFEKYFDFIFRAPQSHDMSLYAGALLIPLALLGIISHRRGYAVSLLVTSIVIFLFCAGTPVTIAAYHLFPGFKYFRHIGLVAPVLKVFLVYLAGYGFESLIEDRTKIKTGCLMVAGYCLFAVTLYWALDSNLFKLNLPQVYSYEKMPFFIVSGALAITSLAAFKINRIAAVYPMLIIIILVVDMFVYRFQYHVKTVPVASDEFVTMFQPNEYGFQMNREDDFNMRFRQFSETPHRWGRMNNLALYDSLNWFFHSDFLISPFNVLTMEKPVAELSNFSMYNYARYAALSQPKLKVYSNIKYINNPLVIRGLLMFGTGNEDFLYSEKSSNEATSSSVNNSFPNIPLTDRVDANFSIIKFSANELTLEVDTRSRQRSDGRQYLYYADAYHPFWKARVNGKATPVIKANIAYKAVEIPLGRSVVEFFVYDPLMIASILLAQSLALLTFIVIWFLFFRWCKGSQTTL